MWTEEDERRIAQVLIAYACVVCGVALIVGGLVGHWLA